MRYFKLFWDALYAFALGSIAAAGFTTCSLCIKKSIKDRKEEKENEERESK